MKKLILVAGALFIASTAFADSDHNNGNGNDDCILSLIGCSGPKGDKGDKGDTGQPGVPGSNGRDGAPGQDGRDGEPGSNGRDGAPGQNGSNGEQGPRGDKGNNGNDGAQGPKGDKGNSGENGAKGKSGKDGLNGEDARLRTQVIGEIGVRLFDTRRFQGQIYNAYDMRAKHNAQVGIRVLYKLGRSYEELALLLQRAILIEQKAQIAALMADVNKLKRYAHHPVAGQHFVFNDPKHTDAEPTTMVSPSRGRK